MAQRALIEFDDSQLKIYEKALRRYAAEAHPFAVRSMLNKAAFQARIEWQKQIKRRMQVRARGKFGAPGSILVDRASKLHPRSIVGSVAPYMVDQEFGGSRIAGGSRGVPIPTSQSSGEGDSAIPRKRVPRINRSLREIALSKRRNRKGGAMSRNRRAMIAVKVAQKVGDEFVYLDLEKHPGIYRVTKSGIKLMHETKRTAVKIPKRPTLLPTIERIRPRMPGIYKAALRKQLRLRNIRLDTRG